ncbi:MAG TPA: hypothetical protein VLD62_02250 [Acidimicrobiia bacterium]|nr:hypothetical protein [Acidimicrobiia bacterium]
MTRPAPLPPLATIYLTVTAGLTAVFLRAPTLRDGILVEDGPLETATAIVFLVAALVAIRLLGRPDTRRGEAWIVVGFGALAFLDEISFGARILGYRSPEIDGITVDSLHDVFDLAERFAERLGVGRTGLAAAALLVLAATTAWVWRSGRAPSIARWLRRHPAVAWCTAAVALLLAAVALDLVGTNEFMRLGEELLELAAATITVRAALSLGTAAPARAEEPVEVAV